MTAVRAATFFALICYILLIAVVFRRARHRAEARYFLLYLAGMTVWQAGQAVVAFTANPDVALTGYRIVAAFAPSFGFFYAMFVRELVNVRTTRALVPLGYILVFGSPLITFLGGELVVASVYLEPGFPMFLPNLGPGAYVLGVAVYAFMLYALYHLVRARHVSTSSIERNRLTYLIIGVPVVILGSAANYLPQLRAYPIDTIANMINAALTAFAIVRYRLLDIQLVMQKGLRYSLTTLIVTMIYFLLVSLSVQVLHLVAGYQVFMLSLVLAAVAAVAVQPLRDMLQGRVDKLFFREKYDAAQMLQRVSRSSAAVLDIEQLTDMILTEIAGAMRIERAAFFLKDETGGYLLAASRGLMIDTEWRLRPDHPLVTYLAARPQVFLAQNLDRLPMARAFRLEEREQWEQLDAELLVPVIAKGALVGVLAVGQRMAGTDYGEDDRLVLMTLANQTAIAVENARLYAAAQHQIAERQRAEARTLDSLHEKEVLLREIHHRVKNNLQVIYSLLSLQSQYAPDAATLEVLRDSQNRIRSMALIHEKLYQSVNLADIDFGEYLRTLAAQLHRSYTTGERKIHLVVSTSPIRLPLDVALPCALIASELISNALKHAFVGRTEGILRIGISPDEDGAVRLEVADDGVGMPLTLPDGQWSEDGGGTLGHVTLGMQLIRGLVRQLDGDMTMSNGRGARFVVSFRPAASVMADVT
ncbi:MAG: GAF domain-containing protein [Anaerolineae bacterium]|nr:GAF domain-containing protein [Anaerolineae bacterium]